MEIQQPKRKDKDEQEGYILKHGSKEGLIQLTPPPSTAASPPSATSSPSHEFSFTISLHHQSATTSTYNTIPSDNKTKPHAASSNIALMDLSPADDIFFHGHLLPLHLLSHLPVSPRSSTNSLDSFTLPIKELLGENKQNCANANNSSTISKNGGDDYEIKTRTKSKSFSWLSSKWRKENEGKGEKGEEGQKRKLKFDVTHVLKRYMRMVRPLLSLRNSRGGGESVEFERKAYSFSSGNLSFRRKQQNHQHYYGGRRRGGEFSAPASMRTSPTNSGLLAASSSSSGPLSNSSSTDSSMEELQAAIQAAIAHCKNSIAVEDKIKCHDQGLGKILS